MKKTSRVYYVILLLIMFLLYAGCATTQDISESPSPECLGVWINTQYNTMNNTAAKIVYYPDMTWEAFEYDFSRKPSWRGTISIVESWKDEEGCCWYKVTTNQLGLNFIAYELWRIGEQGKVLEGVWSTGLMPDYIDQTNNAYTVYYRQGSLARVAKAEQ
jgi:hypothetical protein